MDYLGFNYALPVTLSSLFKTKNMKVAESKQNTTSISQKAQRGMVAHIKPTNPTA